MREALYRLNLAGSGPTQEPMSGQTDDRSRIEKLEFLSQMDAAKELLGGSEDAREQLDLIRKTKEKFGSVDPMKMKQVLRFMTGGQSYPEASLPEKR